MRKPNNNYIDQIINKLKRLCIIAFYIHYTGTKMIFTQKKYVNSVFQLYSSNTTKPTLISPPKEICCSNTPDIHNRGADPFNGIRPCRVGIFMPTLMPIYCRISFPKKQEKTCLKCSLESAESELVLSINPPSLISFVSEEIDPISSTLSMNFTASLHLIELCGFSWRMNSSSLGVLKI